MWLSEIDAMRQILLCTEPAFLPCIPVGKSVCKKCCVFPGFTSLNASVLVLLFSSGAEYCLEFVILYKNKVRKMDAEICGTMSVSLLWKHLEISSPRILCTG